MSDRRTVCIRRTNQTPAEAWIGDPSFFGPTERNIDISVIFTGDKPEAERLAESYRRFGRDFKGGKGYKVNIGGPAYDDQGGEFEPGRYLKKGIVITSRGCINQCPFCYVPKREGKIRELQVKEGHIIQDNNFLSCSNQHKEKVYEMLKNKRSVEFLGGLDPRILTDKDVEAMRGLRIRSLWISADSKDVMKHTKRAIDKLHKGGFKPYQIRCYTLIGFQKETTTEAEARLRELYNYGCFPFAQLWDQNKSKGWNALKKTWARPGIYKTMIKKEGMKEQTLFTE